MEYKKITSMKKIKGKKKVYNFDVPSYENYVANGVVVHNCLNYKVSYQSEGPSSIMMPEDVVQLAGKRGVKAISFSHNEPTLYFEYICDVGTYIHANSSDLKLLIKSNGFVCKHPLDALISITDAFNIDIKGNEEDYQRSFNCSFSTVQHSIEEILFAGKHVEISYLVLPHRLRDMEYHTLTRNWLCELSPSIPVHILYFYPAFRMTKGAYLPEELLPILDLFAEKMKYVYASNAHNQALSKYR